MWTKVSAQKQQREVDLTVQRSAEEWRIRRLEKVRQELYSQATPRAAVWAVSQAEKWRLERLMVGLYPHSTGPHTVNTPTVDFRPVLVISGQSSNQRSPGWIKPEINRDFSVLFLKWSTGWIIHTEWVKGHTKYYFQVAQIVLD